MESTYLVKGPEFIGFRLKGFLRNINCHFCCTKKSMTTYDLDEENSDGAESFVKYSHILPAA